jgi:outer membrane receptor for ferrienterochelin and colicins
MIKYFLPILATCICANVFAQNTFKTFIKETESNNILVGVSVNIKSTNIATTSNTEGQVILKNIPDGKQTIGFSYVGFETIEMTFVFPINDSLQNKVVLLSAKEETEEDVIVQSTRTSRTINNTPTRIETIDAEELDEKSNMRPSNVSMVLHESTGIQVQQTSATSGNASVRIQGLDGRYTQLLKDGYPSFGNFASGLSILEIPPLDLKQVEIIKGPASTLYGAGAIAGVVNFISKTPKEKAAYNFILNQSNVGQTNIGAFAMAKNKKVGYSILALYNYQKYYDVDKDDFTELPKSNDFTIHPKLFFYLTEKATLIIGNSFSNGKRVGGDVEVIKGKADVDHVYFEKNNTTRNTTTFDYTQKLRDKEQLTFKSSFSYFGREIFIPSYTFSGKNNNVFADISYSKSLINQTFIVGANYIFDKFIEQNNSSFFSKNFKTSSGGVYAQHTWDIMEKAKLESGLRTDVVSYSNANYQKTEFFLLPRVSLLYKFNNHFATRVGGGLGYKTPTLFTEQTETFQYQHVLPLNNVTSERSYGGTLDINFKTTLGSHFSFSANQLFFYTKITNASFLQQNTFADFYFSNTDKPVTSTGFETNAKVIFKENFKFFLGYTYTSAKAEYLSGNTFLSLLPKNKVNLALVYEKEDNLKIGLEGYFTDKQYLDNTGSTPSFWEFGFMAEKYFGKISVFINAENFTDQRQSNYKRVVNLPNNNPSFDDIWNHTEGRTFNGGIKIKL